MPRLKISEMTEGVRLQLETSGAFKQAQANLTLTESIPETPLVQVYFETKEFLNTMTDRRTFAGDRTGERPVKTQNITIYVDIYAAQRAEIGRDVKAVQDLVDEVDEMLEAQTHRPYFNLEGVKAFTYRAERVTIEVAQNKYAGVRFILTLTVM